jgi:bifunctional non-homologous end joining protein LigD
MRADAEPLERYRRKRDFSRTSEPSPHASAPGASSGDTFMVHKHDATRLHYDLRFQVDGVLASWACPMVRATTQHRSGSR